jgi:hypothetical protein
MAAEEGDYGDLGSWGLLTVEKRDHEWHEGHEWFFGGGRQDNGDKRMGWLGLGE